MNGREYAIPKRLVSLMLQFAHIISFHDNGITNNYKHYASAMSILTLYKFSLPSDELNDEVYSQPLRILKDICADTAIKPCKGNNGESKTILYPVHNVLASRLVQIDIGASVALHYFTSIKPVSNFNARLNLFLKV